MITTVATASLALRPAADQEFWAVARLFAALHRFNAGLDPRFRLAEGWEALLHEHFQRTHRSPGALWLLAWCGAEPIGLLLMEAHTDAPLFAERRWAELVALYVAPGERGGDLGRQLCLVRRPDDGVVRPRPRCVPSPESVRADPRRRMSTPLPSSG